MYSNEQVAAWKRDAEALKDRVEAVNQQKWLLIEDLENLKLKESTIGDESYARGL